MRHALPVLLLVAFPALSSGAKSEFHYKIPDGWADVLSPSFVADYVPQSLMTEAASGNFAVYAVDPQRATRESAPVWFTVVEVAPTAKLTDEGVRQAAAVMARHYRRVGMTVNFEEIKVVKLNNVDIGFFQSFAKTPRGPARMLQYMIPGRTKIAMLTYACPPEDYDRYRPLFESSAMATTGAYDHSGLTAADTWKRIRIFGTLAAIVAVIVTLMRASKNRPTALRTPSTPTAWDCPNCKRRVPIRVTQCRCGTPQPA
ncbi:MAG: hypothetical protein M3041_09030 [Acidobacteriota bacterium]|nr:hypothetical protein [Acidobacteriota bacterium]